MIFDFNKNNHKFMDVFDEFPEIESYDFRFTKCTCGSKSSFVVSTVSRHRNFLPIVACSDCGTLRANPYFTKETAAHYYGQIYGKVKRNGITPDQLFARQRKASLAPFLSKNEEDFTSVLDFGGGAGGKTFDLISQGKQLALHEVEGKYSQYAHEQGILRHNPSQRYDLVVVSHVIEHMIDPVSEITGLIETCCRKDGLLLIATPIIDHQRARQWLRHFHISHKYYFTHNALIGLMASLGCDLLRQNGRDTYLFRVGQKVNSDFVSASYAEGARKTRALFEADTRPSLKGLWQYLTRWKPQAYDQSNPAP